MVGLAGKEHNNGGIEVDAGPRGLAWMEGYGGLSGEGGYSDVVIFCVWGGWRGSVMRRDHKPCSCRLARSGLRENQKPSSVPSVLLQADGGVLCHRGASGEVGEGGVEGG